MDTANLLRFLRDAHQHGYAAGRAARHRREADHSTTITHETKEWAFHDNYFGGEPYGGRSVVFRKGKPVWMAVYYGRVEGPPAEVQPVYSFLQRALLLPPEDFPVRGPEEFYDNALAYRNAHHGVVRAFRGEETIHHRGERVYTAWYSGGLVDRQPGD